MLSKPARNYLRSARGQLTLFTLTYLAAILLAGGGLVARDWIEGFVLERLPAPSADFPSRLTRLTESSSSLADALTLQEQRDAYGLYINSTLDADAPLPRALARLPAERLATWVRGTCATGSRGQIRQACTLLADVDDPALHADQQRIGAWLARRAERRGEAELWQLAQRMLAELESRARPALDGPDLHSPHPITEERHERR